MIPYSTQTIAAADYDAVLETLSSPYLTCGPKVGEFEDRICMFSGAAHAVAVNSCTSALHLAMLALGVGKGDLAYVSAVSFASSANCARMVGADVEFVDVDPYSGNLDCDALEDMLEQARTAGRLPKVLVAVDLSGRRLDFARIKSLQAEYGFKIVEDAAHALGATYRGDRAGSGKYADITCLSFHPVKIITTAEGGMALTNDDALYAKMRALSSHGITHDGALMHDQSMPAFYYEMQDLGYNYRMPDLLASLGVAQMDCVEAFLALRRRKAKDYAELLRDCAGLVLPAADTDDNVSSWHLYQVWIKDGRRDEIYRALRDADIGVQVHYLPIYRHPYYRSIGNYAPLKGAEHFFEGTLSIPLFPKLSTLQQQMVAAKLCSLLDKKR